ncbi:ATP synthase F1 subunit gamma [Patescibacteria group bacterium]|nr:ATP synthase F1 subunit gamma [Patescibacteria group bacterium]MBU1473011.1 ATP synthase F1 subunit gamma [Patescibacteria group bacterium]MBU2460346.1 ATP synthase F1 subunit gamma [Patescibacteria group bacterium]MBU2544631.1 ATP synthase F1 subunit gamma [Patescibacteria group bacterium]
MANIRLIKRRVKSARNIAQITKAMELVAASKMKKAQMTALSSKLYAQKIYDMVLALSAKVTDYSHPLFLKPPVMTGKRLVISISTNKGLCGGLNASLFRFLIREYKELPKHDHVTVGRKGADFLSRIGAPVVADFSKSTPFVSIVPALIELVSREYGRGLYDGVDLVYSEFVSSLKQVPRKKTIVPLVLDAPDKTDESLTDFVIEPEVNEVFRILLPHYLENQVRDAVLQAEASEHSARMIAMRNATDNAQSLIGDLTLAYNKARQERITYEILDLVTARLAVE